MNKQQIRDYQRTLLLEFTEEDYKPLKPAVAKAMQAAEIDDSQLASRLNRNLVKSGYYRNERVGRNFQSKLTQAGVEFLQELIEAQINPPAPKVDEPEQEAVALAVTDLPASGLHLNRRLDKPTWSRIMRMVTKNNFQTAFIPAGVEVFIRNPETDEMTKVQTIA